MARAFSLAIAFVASTTVLVGCGSKPESAPKTRSVTYAIEAPSMEPTFRKGDRVTLSPTPSTLETGMIVIFKDPAGWFGSSSQSKQIKRIVGVGGDRVRCCDSQGRIVINGKALNEQSYLPVGAAASDVPFDVKVPAGHLWLMGDNRPDSPDSRAHMGDPGGGFVDERLVVGLVDPDRNPINRH
jgi:signal peptidase I